MADLSNAKNCVARALEDLESATEQQHSYIGDVPAVFRALAEVRAAKKAIAEYEVELEERQL